LVGALRLAGAVAARGLCLVGALGALRGFLALGGLLVALVTLRLVGALVARGLCLVGALGALRGFLALGAGLGLLAIVAGLHGRRLVTLRLVGALGLVGAPRLVGALRFVGALVARGLCL